MSEPRTPLEWQKLYAAAMLELNSDEARIKIEIADAAVKARLMELPETERREKAELHSALAYLRRLKANQT